MISKSLIVAQAYAGMGVYGDGSVNDPHPLSVGDARYPQGNLYVSIVGTSASVSVYGRASPAAPWVAVAAPITASGITSVPLLAEMYAAVTAINAATVNAAINYPSDT